MATVGVKGLTQQHFSASRTIHIVSYIITGPECCLFPAQWQPSLVVHDSKRNDGYLPSLPAHVLIVLSHRMQAACSRSHGQHPRRWQRKVSCSHTHTTNTASVEYTNWKTSGKRFLKADLSSGTTARSTGHSHLLRHSDRKEQEAKLSLG